MRSHNFDILPLPSMMVGCGGVWLVAGGRAWQNPLVAIADYLHVTLEVNIDPLALPTTESLLKIASIMAPGKLRFRTETCTS